MADKKKSTHREKTAARPKTKSNGKSAGPANAGSTGSVGRKPKSGSFKASPDAKQAAQGAAGALPGRYNSKEMEAVLLRTLYDGEFRREFAASPRTVLAKANIHIPRGVKFDVHGVLPHLKMLPKTSRLPHRKCYRTTGQTGEFFPPSRLWESGKLFEFPKVAGRPPFPQPPSPADAEAGRTRSSSSHSPSKVSRI